ncbi:hypothetical protein GUITHDRAFT_151271 [Guillardia theta CCMP2712]|uniref:Uncharacterized protein n=2 Tax=Guillardia theta TaxID=55529 RepID=L1JPW5_GUITC|nr:hypothetical protein GUITHDRAFT_151271 [Guillardia theta CCMP2712]EKX50289.1 hypothetical protein GUITHDRAFT_151271 [Guillardia theta CCMP2712]|eukprot:XP_005837269.1 hypothetical protein GUITHDRAFT_151271 [Guillardia theta CCMP2712]
MMRGDEIFNVTLQRICPPVLNYSNYQAASHVMPGESGIRTNNYSYSVYEQYSNGSIGNTRVTY